MDSSNTIAAGGGATHSGSAAPGSASASSTASSNASSNASLSKTDISCAAAALAELDDSTWRELLTRLVLSGALPSRPPADPAEKVAAIAGAIKKLHETMFPEDSSTAPSLPAPSLPAPSLPAPSLSEVLSFVKTADEDWDLDEDELNDASPDMWTFDEYVDSHRSTWGGGRGSVAKDAYWDINGFALNASRYTQIVYQTPSGLRLGNCRSEDPAAEEEFIQNTRNAYIIRIG